MEEAKIEEEFANKLNGLDLLEEVDVSAICWFVEDFEKCSEIFASQIINRILNPYKVAFFKRETPVITLFYVIDAIINNLKPDLQRRMIKLFKPNIANALSVAIGNSDKKTAQKITDLVSIWNKKELFGEEVSANLQDILNPKAPHIASLIQVNPLSFDAEQVNPLSLETTQTQVPKKQRSLMKSKELWVTLPSEICEHDTQ